MAHPKTAISFLNAKYRLDRLLGEGGMGAVYAAWDTSLGVPVAIKLLKPGLALNERQVRRFLQEARAAAQVRHAHIVTVLGVDQDPASNIVFIVQELLEGTDLKRRLAEQGPIAHEPALKLLLPVMRALAHAHSRGVVHRDLKPDNIFLCDTPEGIIPKIIDFGIAKVIDEDGVSAQQTHTQQVFGTPNFMSPEQARGDKELDRRTDIWSLGVVLFNMLTGRLPFNAATSNLMMVAIIRDTPASVRDFVPELPAPVDELVRRALQRDPAERFQTMDEFWQAANACLGIAVDAPVRAFKPSPSRASLSQVSSPGTGPPREVDSLAGHAPSRPLGWAALGLTVCAGVVFTVAYQHGGQRARPVAPPPHAALVRAAPTPAEPSRPPTASPSLAVPDAGARVEAPPPDAVRGSAEGRVAGRAWRRGRPVPARQAVAATGGARTTAVPSAPTPAAPAASPTAAVREPTVPGARPSATAEY